MPHLKYNRPQFDKPHYEPSGSALTWRFPFGIYKGRPITRPPTNYLAWLRHNTHNDDVARRCSQEIERRNAVAGKPAVKTHRIMVDGPKTYVYGPAGELISVIPTSHYKRSNS